MEDKLQESGCRNGETRNQMHQTVQKRSVAGVDKGSDSGDGEEGYGFEDLQ